MLRFPRKLSRMCLGTLSDTLAREPKFVPPVLRVGVVEKSHGLPPPSDFFPRREPTHYHPFSLIRSEHVRSNENCLWPRLLVGLVRSAAMLLELMRGSPLALTVLVFVAALLPFPLSQNRLLSGLT